MMPGEARRKRVLPQIDEILSVLKNGKWHDLKEISEKTNMKEPKVEMLTDFLAEYSFVELDQKEHKTRLTQPLLHFLRKVQELEEKEGLRLF
jgi:DNA-binding IclR family transcriptional regulator